MPRLFVALELPEPLRQAVRELQFGLRGARWLDDDSLHLTLVFIGEADSSAQRRIETALSFVEAPPLRMELHGLGHFPPRGGLRALWTAASPRTGLVSLARAVRRALERSGFTSQRRKLTPHVTIARFPRPPHRARLEEYLRAHSLFRTPQVEIGSFHLFSSALRPDGARYTIEATFPLAGTPRGGSGPE